MPAHETPFAPIAPQTNRHPQQQLCSLRTWCASSQIARAWRSPRLRSDALRKTESERLVEQERCQLRFSRLPTVANLMPSESSSTKNVRLRSTKPCPPALQGCPQRTEVSMYFVVSTCEVTTHAPKNVCRLLLLQELETTQNAQMCAVDDTSCFLTIRLGPKTSVYEEHVSVKVYCSRL